VLDGGEKMGAADAVDKCISFFRCIHTRISPSRPPEAENNGSTKKVIISIFQGGSLGFITYSPTCPVYSPHIARPGTEEGKDLEDVYGYMSIYMYEYMGTRLFGPGFDHLDRTSSGSEASFARWR
jgi:hypothetical protein